MRALGCNLGGEQSGHIILADYATTGDGLIAALQVLASIVETDRRAKRGLSAVHLQCRKLLRSVRYGDGRPLESPAVKRAIADGESRLATAGRLVTRESGTEPVIRVMAESEDEALIAAVIDEICEAIAAVGVGPEDARPRPLRSTPARSSE